MFDGSEFPARHAPPDEQRRLRWLGEDLAACLTGLGSIAARLSETGSLPRPTWVVVSAPTAGDWSPAVEESDPGAAGCENAPPVASIVWVWDDGRRVEYDWRAEICRRTDPEDVTSNGSLGMGPPREATKS